MNDTQHQFTIRYRAIQHEATTAPLKFRRHAREALKQYPATYRSESNALKTDDTLAIVFYRQWEETLAPNLRIIQTADTNKRLINEVKKSYVLQDEEAIKLIQNISATRTQEEESRFLSLFYAQSDHKPRKAAAAFFDRSDNENLERIEKFIDYELYSAAAQDSNMTIYDQHARVFARIVQRLRERSQVKRFVRSTNKRIEAINVLTSQLETEDNGLIASLFTLHIDLVTIRASYQKYEKALEKLSEAARKSPAKRLALYEKETSTIRAAHLDSVSGMESLRDIQQVAKEIDTVLMRVFDLNTRQYNELMMRMKKYRELSRERLALQQSLKIN
jgi:hypothetical protein